MKILFVGDASNLHNCLAHALRDLGHTAVVASNGSHWMNTERDINLERNPGKIGAVRYVLDVLRALPKMRDFDVVQTCGHIFLDLKPGKVRRVFDFLKRHNRSIVMGALGTDYVYYTACHDGKTYRYSCLNFCLLADAMQRITHSPLNYFVNQYVFAPLGAYHTLYRPLSKFGRDQIAYTEVDTYLRRQHIHGYVHDELAAFSGGVQGNAGLFSSANDLAKLLQMWLNGGTYGGTRLLKASTVDVFTKQKSPNSHRGLGFDKPVIGNPDASNTCPEATPETYGHTGFTGTRFWVDPANDMLFIFLSNRVSPSRNNPAFGRISASSHIQSLIYQSIEK